MSILNEPSAPEPKFFDIFESRIFSVKCLGRVNPIFKENSQGYLDYYLAKAPVFRYVDFRKYIKPILYRIFQPRGGHTNVVSRWINSDKIRIEYRHENPINYAKLPMMSMEHLLIFDLTFKNPDDKKSFFL